MFQAYSCYGENKRASAWSKNCFVVCLLLFLFAFQKCCKTGNRWNVLTVYCIGRKVRKFWKQFCVSTSCWVVCVNFWHFGFWIWTLAKSSYDTKRSWKPENGTVLNYTNNATKPWKSQCRRLSGINGERKYERSKQITNMGFPSKGGPRRYWRTINNVGVSSSAPL